MGRSDLGMLRDLLADLLVRLLGVLERVLIRRTYHRGEAILLAVYPYALSEDEILEHYRAWG